MTITRNFTLEELTASDTAKSLDIKNVPNTQEIINLSVLTAKILQPLRNAMKEPIGISSGFRSEKLNKTVGGVSNSQHRNGQAVDIDINGDLKKGKKWFAYIRDNLEFDQLIWEHSRSGVYWIHVSYDNIGSNRKQVIDNLLKR